ncbi:permease prefix domain 1-containing protein [Brachybacterium sp. FME24]|uniref:permease prefix domain 1-containing protein n=1 Tax=Brachybacterium sp. FME24 TaxID=2742605 RepID=UPI0018671D65|nr:permease prefix domain 1-containing protein [Brachybacterium sp. FME24]
MNVIDSYLDTLFAPYPDSARMREARSELGAMMEDKQQGLLDDGFTEPQAIGKVIAEFGSLEEVAPVLGISTELGGSSFAEAQEPSHVSPERAEEYVAAVRRSQWMPAVAVPMFVLSAVPLLLLFAATGSASPQPPPWATGTGLVLLLVMVGAAVMLLVARDAKLGDFSDLEEGDFDLSPPVRRFAKDLKRQNRRAVAIAVAIAIMLWILSAVPTILAGLAAEPEGTGTLYGVSLTLMMVALGLWVLLRQGWSDQAADNLLKESEDEDSPDWSTSPAIRAIAALYWPVIVAIYLAWSFIWGAWEISWVLWPVAGVLYAGLWSLNVAVGRHPEGTATGRSSA